MPINLRVLLITARTDHGGGPRHILDLLNAFAGREITFYMGAPNQDPYGPIFHRLVKKFFEIPAQSFSPFAFFRLVRVVRRARIDIIHSHGRGAGVYSRLLGILTGCRVLHTFHGIHRDPSAVGRIKLFVDRVFSFFPFTPIFVSQNEREEALRFGCVRADDGFVIENAVDLSRFTPRAADSPLSNPIRIGAFTRPDLAKGPDRLISVALQNAEEGEWSCVGIEQEELAAFGEIPPNLKVLGRVDEPAKWLQSLDVFVSTARNEGLPLGVLEAMAAGCLCVLSDIPAHRGFAEAGAAVLYDPECTDTLDSISLQNALTKLRADSNARREIRLAADRLVDAEHTLATFRLKLERVYRGAEF